MSSITSKEKVAFMIECFSKKINNIEELEERHKKFQLYTQEPVTYEESGQMLRHLIKEGKLFVINKKKTK